MQFYIFQIIIFQLLFLLVYELLLKKETFYLYNRVYLLVTPVLSFLLPLLKIKSLGKVVTESNIIQLPAVILNQNSAEIFQMTQDPVVLNATSINWIPIIYFSGIAVSSVVFLLKYSRILRMGKRSRKWTENNVNFVEVKNSDVACTFFNTIYLGDQLPEDQKNAIVSHEIVHSRQKHSADLLYFEILKIIFWFNPVVYLYQSRISALHEFIADQEAVKTSEKISYYEQLLNTAFGTKNISFINQFFNHSLIKKRIVMLQKSKSKSVAKFKYLVMVPVITVMLTYVSCTAQDETAIPQDDNSISAQVDRLKQTLDAKGDISEEEMAKIRQLILVAYNNSESVRSAKEAQENAIPYAVIDQVPTFPGCENLGSNEEQKRCTSDKISEFVAKNFDIDKVKPYSKDGDNRVIVQFKIDETGNITNIRARASSPELEEEGKRVISTIPKMSPGRQKGSAVGVMYSLPIVYRVDGVPAK